MKFFAFHLMPYRHLDFDKADAYRSYWVVLPNSHYDPKKGPRLYQEYIDQLVFAAKVGFDGICVNEHHQTAYGLMPAPNIIASALIERTRGMDVKIAVIGSALPIVSNPLTIAEEFAMLDNLSDGRLIAGFVRGIGCEYHSTEVNPIYSHERFHEAHDLIVRAWTEPGPFAFEGEALQLRLRQHLAALRTDSRIRRSGFPSQGSGETIEWAAAPRAQISGHHGVQPDRRGHPVSMDPIGEQAEKSGYEISGISSAGRSPTYVAETDEIAARGVRPALLEALFNNFFHIPPELLFPPGYTSIRSLQAMLESRKGLAAARVTFNDLMTRGNRHRRQPGDGAGEDRSDPRQDRLPDHGADDAVRHSAG